LHESGVGVTTFIVTDLTPPQKEAVQKIYRALEQRSAADLIEEFPNPSPMDRQILEALKAALDRVKKSKNPEPVFREVLSVIGSWGDTLSEKNVRDYLRAIASSGSYLTETFADTRDK
jgi:hypothetical protein